MEVQEETPPLLVAACGRFSEGPQRIHIQAYFLHTPVPKSTLFVTRPKNSAEIEPWGAPRA